MVDAIKFGTDGWRAVIAEEFTFANVELVAQAIGNYVKESYPQAVGGALPILIGYDTRFLADKFAHHCAQVLSQMGLKTKVSNYDIPTPCLAFAAQSEPSAGAIQITASHNPPEYCGMKYISHFGGPATNDITEKIVSHLKDRSNFDSTALIELELCDFKTSYMEALAKAVDLPRIASGKLRVGYDALYSTSRGYLDTILEKHGVELKTLHNWRDCNFGGGMPEPKREYLKELMATVKTHQLDAGIATDGDADRFAVIDEGGNYLPPNQLLCLLVRHLVKNRGMRGNIVRTVSTTHLLDHLAKQYGLEVIETPVGFKYIGEQMRQGDVLIGGEESGGVSIKGHIPEKDGILANLLVLEMIAVESKPISRIWQDLVNEIGRALPTSKREDVRLTFDVQRAVMQRLQTSPLTELAGRAVTKISRLDGIKIYLDEDTWLLIRSSGTEPLLRLYSEADKPEDAELLLADFKSKVSEILTSLGNSGKLTQDKEQNGPKLAVAEVH
jgi:phosphomannomutase